MNAQVKDKPELYLMPGQIWFGGGDFRLRTILGASVVVTLWQPLRRVGGMCHLRQDSPSSPSSLAELFKAMAAAGTQPEECDIRLFGGGRMFSNLACRKNDDALQRQTIQTTREQIHASGARIAHEQLGGNGHRQLLFDITSGDTWLRHWPVIEPIAQPISRIGESR